MVTAETLAAAILRDVPRYGLTELGPVKGGQWMHCADVLAALSRAMSDDLAERAGEVIRWLIEADDRGDGNLAMVHCAPAADLITALLTANAALRAERDALAAEVKQADAMLVAEANASLERLTRAERLEAAIRKLRDRWCVADLTEDDFNAALKENSHE